MRDGNDSRLRFLRRRGAYSLQRCSKNRSSRGPYLRTKRVREPDAQVGRQRCNVSEPQGGAVSYCTQGANLAARCLCTVRKAQIGGIGGKNLYARSKPIGLAPKSSSQRPNLAAGRGVRRIGRNDSTGCMPALDSASAHVTSRVCRLFNSVAASGFADGTTALQLDGSQT